jgi:hypothetical protein
MYDFSDPAVMKELRRAGKALARDRAPVAVAQALEPRLVSALANEKVCAIHIPGFFSARLATRAARTLATSKRERWIINGAPTDTSYSVGVPRKFAEQSKVRFRVYEKRAVAAMRFIRDAFAPHLSPMDRLRLELDELWGAGAHVTHRDGKTHLAGLVRTLDPSTLFGGVAGKKGICHIDDPRQAPEGPHILSANLYLEVPANGGQLRVWDVLPGASNAGNVLHKLIRTLAFHEGSQEAIHTVLPKPHVVRPGPGDLVLLDVGRPHAVEGFTRGRRVSIQCWVVAEGPDRPLQIYS